MILPVKQRTTNVDSKKRAADLEENSERIISQLRRTAADQDGIAEQLNGVLAQAKRATLDQTFAEKESELTRLRSHLTSCTSEYVELLNNDPFAILGRVSANASDLMGVADVASTFLESEFKDEGEALQGMLKAIGNFFGPSAAAHYYAHRRAGQDSAIVLDAFVLAASTNAAASLGEACPPSHAAILRKALKDKMAHTSAGETPHISATVVMTSLGLEGVLVIEVPLNILEKVGILSFPAPQYIQPIARTRIGSTLRLWSSALSEKIERLQRRAEVEFLTVSLDSILRAMKNAMDDQVDYLDRLDAISDMIPEPSKMVRSLSAPATPSPAGRNGASARNVNASLRKQQSEIPMHQDSVNSHATPTAVSTMFEMRSCFVELIEATRKKEAMHALSEALGGSFTTEEMAFAVQSTIGDLMFAETCTLYSVNSAGDKVRQIASDESTPHRKHIGGKRETVGLKHPKSPKVGRVISKPFQLGRESSTASKAAARRKGSIGKETSTAVALKMAKTAIETGSEEALVFNTSESLAAWLEASGSNDVVKNLLTVPIWVMSEEDSEAHLLGVIEVVNKRNYQSESEFVDFTPADIQLMQAFAECVGLHMNHEMLGVFVDDQDKSFFEEYYATSAVGQSISNDKFEKKKAMLQGLSKVLGVVKAFQSDGSKKRAKELQRRFDDWHLDYWDMSHDDQLNLVEHALKTLGANFPVPQATMINFFEGVKGTYNSNAFHNFDHAMSTVHYSYMIVKSTGLVDRFRTADIFALIIGALCHDCAHPGRNNPFQVQSRSDLAIRYNDISVLENHHSATAFGVAFNGSQAKPTNIFEPLEKDDYETVRKRMVNAILSTDMARHGEHVKMAKDYIPGGDEDFDAEESQLLIDLFLHSADISNPYMPPDISDRWQKLLFKEFGEQAEDEQRLGIPVTAHYVGLEDPRAAAKSQLGFIDFVVKPLLAPIFHKFEGLVAPKGFLDRNRQVAADSHAKLESLSSFIDGK